MKTRKQIKKATQQIEVYTQAVDSLFAATEQICDSIDDLAGGHQNLRQIEALTVALRAMSEQGRCRLGAAADECGSIRIMCGADAASEIEGGAT